MSASKYTTFKEDVLDAIHDYTAFHGEPPTRQIALEDAVGSAAASYYKLLDRMRDERLIKYMAGPNRGTLVTILEEN